MADFYVSYTSSDKEWAFWIGRELEKLGHTPRIHEWELKSGDDIVAWMQEHLEAAEHVLCVLSEEYLRAPYSTFERNAALWRAVGTRPGSMLLVVVKRCQIPVLMAQIRRCELYGLSEDQARERFAQFLGPVGPLELGSGARPQFGDGVTSTPRGSSPTHRPETERPLAATKRATEAATPRTTARTKRKRPATKTGGITRPSTPPEVERSSATTAAADASPDNVVDAFILYNGDEEPVVADVVKQLESFGISTHYWERDVPVGRPLANDDERLAVARAVVLLIGSKGWGPTHLELAEEAGRQKKIIIPVAIAAPPAAALEPLGGLLRDRRYFDLRRQGVEALAALIREQIAGGVMASDFFVPRPDPPTPDTTPITFARMGNDNPDRATLDDKLGAEDEAKAFARVAAARQVDPPLAFGVFGNWGSGKSFFMRLMHKHVEQLADEEAQAAKEAEKRGAEHIGPFHQNIVQIRFNAWHYVETNLWASLVDTIFGELDRWMQRKQNPAQDNTLFDNLATARDLTLQSAEQLVMRRKEQKVAAERLAAAERQLTAEKEKAGVTPRFFWTVVRSEFEKIVPAKDIEQAAATLGLGQLASDAERLKTELDALKDETHRAQVVANGLRSRLTSAPSLILMLLAIVLVPPLLLWLQGGAVKLTANYPNLKTIIQNINGVVLGIAGVLASAATLAGQATAAVRAAVAKMEGYRTTLDEVISEQIQNADGVMQKAQANLAKLNADVAEAQAMLTTSSDRLAEAAREYASGTGRGRMLQFVRQRATDGQYAKHLGLIATVRKDFSELSAMLSQADESLQLESQQRMLAYAKRVRSLIRAANREKLFTPSDRATLRQSIVKSRDNPAPAFERVILYIDDLDRCPPRKVVDVLQAIHLLLTFPLFVVVVAVDVRWVTRCLERYYADLLVGDSSDATTPGASARDYLEKIFQVPYWVRPMTKDGSRDLLMSLAATPPAAAAPAPRRPVARAVNSPGNVAVPDPLDRLDPPAPAARVVPPPPPKQDAPSPAPVAAPTTVQIAARALELSDAERAFMSVIAPCVGDTPRRVLRFLNTYRVIKASLDAEGLQKLEKEGGYRGLMTQLAVATASPGLHKPWSELLESAATSDDLPRIQDRLAKAGWFSASADADRRLHDAIKTFWSQEHTIKAGGRDAGETAATVAKVLRQGIKELREYDTLSQRYSFGASARTEPQPPRANASAGSSRPSRRRARGPADP